jgi:hypothetical protein
MSDNNKVSTLESLIRSKWAEIVVHVPTNGGIRPVSFNFHDISRVAEVSNSIAEIQARLLNIEAGGDGNITSSDVFRQEERIKANKEGRDFDEVA